MAHERGQSEQAALNKGFIDPAQSLGVVIKGFDGTNYPALSVDADGKLKVDVDMATEGIATEATLAKIPGLSIPMHDFISQTQNSDNDVWTFKVGGSGGATVSTVTITYTDTTKAIISTVART